MIVVGNEAKKILLVDDEEVVLEITQAMLENFGFATVIAKDGFQALDVYKRLQSEISMVLMDMTMPRMSGRVCAEALLELNPDVKIVLSSGYSEQEVTQQFKGIQLSGIIQKPIDFEQLHSTVTNLLKAG
ncbi:MAG: response regulator [Ghiorsea sp.]